MDGLRSDTNSRFDAVDNRFDELNSRINVLLIVMIGAWATITGAIITVGHHPATHLTWLNTSLTRVGSM